MNLRLIVALSLVASATHALVCGADSDLGGARRLFLMGHYDEARQSYGRLSGVDSVAAALGQARCWDSVGELDHAIESLELVARRHPIAAAPPAELARLELERGHIAEAQKYTQAALALDPDRLDARYMAAELHRLAGRLDEANDAYRWFIQYYNRERDGIRDPEVLRWIGLAAAQYARWNRNAGQFHFLVNTLYPDALALDPSYWPAHLETALLFIEKYNLPAADAELDSAMAINPHAAEVHAARGLVAVQRFDLDSARAEIKRALAINPRLVVVHQLEADVRLIASGAREAIPILEQARALDPVNEETLGRLAAAYGAADGLRKDPTGTRMGAVIAEATQRNEHCGAFYAAVGASLTRLARFPYAARYYEEARRRMPQVIDVPGQLGLVYMQLAEEARAKELLEEAFRIDPFNVRVKNTLDVLELLDGYATVETEHFRIRFDGTRDSLLARYVARHLEGDVYGSIVKEFGYAPPSKTLIEIFSSAKGISGHSWFSARMSGLPFIGPVAACAGRVVAITSPSDEATRFNWARVLKHEFVHVVNLQQTDFNIARWYTEGLAVKLEGPGRPESWDDALARRVAVDRLFDLGSINMGFLRPAGLDDWALAYYQSELYVQFMANAYGPSALTKMIAAYGDQLDTGDAIKRSLGVGLKDFENAYRAYVGKLAPKAGLRALPVPERPITGRALLDAVERAPRDADLQTRLALEYVRSNMVLRAKEHAVAALEVNPKHQRAALALATVYVREGEPDTALATLRGAFDSNAPDPDMLGLFATLTSRAGDYAQAESLLVLGQERFPGAAGWRRALAGVYRMGNEKAKLATALGELAERDANDLDSRKELTQLALERNDLVAATRWATEALHIDVRDAGSHAALARGLVGDGRFEPAIEEYDTAIQLEPKGLEWRLALAEACVAAKKTDRARQVLRDLLDRDGQFPGAREMQTRLAP